MIGIDRLIGGLLRKGGGDGRRSGQRGLLLKNRRPSPRVSFSSSSLVTGTKLISLRSEKGRDCSTGGSGFGESVP